MELFKMYAVSQHHDTVERQPRFGAIPIDELSDRVIIRTLSTLRSERVENCSLRQRQIGQAQDAFWCLPFLSSLSYGGIGL